MTNDKDFDDEMARVIDALVLKGLVEVVGIDPVTQEFLYQITGDLDKLIPDLRQEGEKMYLEMLDSLWIKGFISMDKTEENPIVHLTDLAFDEEKVNELSFEERTALYTTMEAMKRKKQED